MIASTATARAKHSVARPSRPRKKLGRALLACLLTAAGCTSKYTQQGNLAADSWAYGSYDTAALLLEPLAQRPDPNYVLNNLRLGSTYLSLGRLNESSNAFYRAFEVINAGGVNDAARVSTAVLFGERVKIWKGEPFERAWANAQFGTVLLLQGDFDNARGALENALFKLRAYEDDSEKYQEVESTFAAARLMLAWTWLKLGREDFAEQQLALVRSTHPPLREVATLEQFAGNVLLIVEAGGGPRKTALEDGSTVAFIPTPDEVGTAPPLRVTLNGRPVPGVNASGDSIAMAAQRRWQTIDTIRAVKSVTGDVMILGGAVVTADGINDGDGTQALVGLAAMGLGALLKGSSLADVRQWEMVPRSLYVMPLHLPPGTHTLTVSAASPAVTVPNVPGEAGTVVYVRLLPARNIVQIGGWDD